MTVCDERMCDERIKPGGTAGDFTLVPALDWDRSFFDAFSNQKLSKLFLKYETASGYEKNISNGRHIHHEWRKRE